MHLPGIIVTVTLVWTLTNARKFFGKEAPTAIPEAECHPRPTSGAKQFLTAFSSYINDKIKFSELPDAGPSLPVKVKGFSREWNSVDASVSAQSTYLGAVKRHGAIFNGVMFLVPSENDTQALDTWTRYDASNFEYCRVLVPIKDIELLEKNATMNPTGNYWVYVLKEQFIGKASKKYPIVQSYVDVYLDGCLDVQTKFGLKEFTNECIDWTEGWSTFYINDRIYPRRAYVYEPNSALIDTALNSRIPEIYKKIKLEG